jgi:hypothetical protein
MSEVTLTRMREFAKNRIWDMRECSFLPENMVGVLTKLRQCLIVGLLMLNDLVLSTPNPDPRSLIKHQDVSQTMFGEILPDVQENLRRAERLRKGVADIHRGQNTFAIDRTDEPWLMLIGFNKAKTEEGEEKKRRLTTMYWKPT